MPSDFINNGLSKYVAHLLETSVQTINSLAFKHQSITFTFPKRFNYFYQNNKKERDMEMEVGVLTSFNKF